MATVPEPIAEFLGGKRIAVAGVSRTAAQAANAIYRKLRDAGFETLPVNPNATTVEGVKCYPDLAAIPGTIDGVVVATRPEVAIELVRQCSERGVRPLMYCAPVDFGHRCMRWWLRWQKRVPG
jgi:predicted CoA-binding protein